jgi:hypothetical protein
MIGKKITNCLLINLMLAFCLKSFEKTEFPTLWVDFKKGIICGMSQQEFLKYCDSSGWSGVRGTKGYGYKEFKKINENGDPIISGYRFITALLVGNEKDSAKIYVEFLDSGGCYFLSGIWHSKKDLKSLLKNINNIKMSKSLCD